MARYEVVTSGRNHYVVDAVSREFSGTAFTSRRAAQDRADEKNGETAEPARVRVAGVAGGVGTTVAAALLEGDDLGLDAAEGFPSVRRAAFVAGDAVVLFAGRNGTMDEPLEDVVVDLVADLMHLCDAAGLDWSTVEDKAGVHHDEDTDR